MPYFYTNNISILKWTSVKTDLAFYGMLFGKLVKKRSLARTYFTSENILTDLNILSLFCLYMINVTSDKLQSGRFTWLFLKKSQYFLSHFECFELFTFVAVS